MVRKGTTDDSKVVATIPLCVLIGELKAKLLEHRYAAR